MSSLAVEWTFAGCRKEMSIFFTANGILMGHFSCMGLGEFPQFNNANFTGKQIPIDHPPMAGDLFFPPILVKVNWCILPFLNGWNSDAPIDLYYLFIFMILQ
jgi:hypothetical protein